MGFKNWIDCSKIYIGKGDKMGEVYKSRKKGALSRLGGYLKGYTDPIPLVGGLLGTGIAYMGSIVTYTTKELVYNTLPNVVNGGSVQEAITRLPPQEGFTVAAELGLIGFILGVLTTRHARDKVYDFFGWLIGGKKK